MKPIKIFSDSSVILAGLASTTGASAEVLRIAEFGAVEITLSKLVIEEVERNIKNKLPELLPLFYVALEVIKPKIASDESELNKKLTYLFPKKSDQIIIQTALKSKVDYIITLDKKHLPQPAVQKMISIPIVTPCNFLNKIRNLA